MNYSNNFNDSFKFYFNLRKKFTFSGDHLRNKKGEILIIEHNKNGVDAKQAFFKYESTGKLVPTKHPTLLFSLLKCKASTNWHIKELYAKDIANNHLSKEELENEIYTELNPPQWFKDSVENQIIKIKKSHGN